MKLYHPGLGRYHEVTSERVAAGYRRAGWVNTPEGASEQELADAVYFVGANGGFDDPPQMSEQHPPPSPSAEGFSDAQPQQED